MRKVALSIIATSRHHKGSDAQRKTSRSMAQLAADAAEPLSALKVPFNGHADQIPDSYLVGMNAFEQTIAILSRPNYERTEVDLMQITSWLRHRSDVFKRLRNDQLITLLKRCKYLKPKRDEVVVRQGDPGDCCYINLSGKVSIYINADLNEPQEPDEDGDGIMELPPPINLGDICRNRECLGTFVVSLGAGAPFGEMALLSADSTRKAYVVADEEMHVIEISRELFNLTMRTCIEEDYRDKRTFINTSAFFSKWTPDFKEQLAMALEREVYFYDQFVVRQGDTADALYFLINGEAQIFLNPVAHEQNFRRQILEGRDTADCVRQKVRQLKLLLAQKFHKKEAMKSLEEEDDLLSFEAFKEDTVTKEQSLFRPGTRPRSSSATEKKRMITLCVQRPVGVIGDLEYFLQLDKYSHSVLCTQRTVVLKLETRQYDRLSKRNPSTTQLMMQVLTNKLRHRIDGSQTVCNEVPLMKYALLKSYALCQNHEYEQLKQERMATITPSFSRTRGTRSASTMDEPLLVRSLRRDYERKALISPLDRRDVTIPLEYLRSRFGSEFSSLIGLNRPIAESVDEAQASVAWGAKRRSHTARAPSVGAGVGTMELPVRRTRSAVTQVQLTLQPTIPLHQVNLQTMPLDNSALKRNNCFLMFRNRGIYSLG